MNKIKMLLISFLDKEEALNKIIVEANLERLVFDKPPIEAVFCHYAEKSNKGFYSKEYTHFLVPADLSYLESDLEKLHYENIKDIMLLYAKGEKNSGNLFSKDQYPNEANGNRTIFYSQYAGERHRLIAHLCNL